MIILSTAGPAGRSLGVTRVIRSGADLATGIDAPLISSDSCTVDEKGTRGVGAMTDLWADAERRAREYARQNSLLLCDQLGAGQDGIVFATDAGSAVKSLR